MTALDTALRRLRCRLFGHDWMAPPVSEPALSHCVCVRCGEMATMQTFWGLGE
jgi:hypothetical protein